MTVAREEFYEPGQGGGNPRLPEGKTERKWLNTPNPVKPEALSTLRRRNLKTEVSL